MKRYIMKKAYIATIYLLLLSVLITSAFFLCKRVPEERYGKLSDFAGLLGKRIVFWGKINEDGDGTGEFSYVMIFGKPQLKMGLGFYDATDLTKFFKDAKPFSTENPTSFYAYVSGVVTYYNVDFENNPELKEDMESGIPTSPLVGEFLITNLQLIRACSRKEKDFTIKLLPLTTYDMETIKTPYLYKGNQEFFKKYIKYLHSIGN